MVYNLKIILDLTELDPKQESVLKSMVPPREREKKKVTIDVNVNVLKCQINKVKCD